jgi:hypothetical protein
MLNVIYTILYYTILYYTECDAQYIIPHCTIQYNTILTVMHILSATHTILHYTIPDSTTLYYTILY